MLSLNLQVTGIKLSDKKSLIQCSYSRRWVLKMSSCRALLRLLKRTFNKFLVRLAAALSRRSSLGIKAYCFSQMRSAISTKSAQKYTVSLKMH